MDEYEVKDGDTLSAIAQKMLGDAKRWPEIYEANKREMDAAWAKAESSFSRIGAKSFRPWDYLRFGQKLRIPS